MEGRIGTRCRLPIFFGFPTGISGGELTYSAQLQAYRFGAKFSMPSQAFTLALTDGEPREPKAARIRRTKCDIIATGPDCHRLAAEGREDFVDSFKLSNDPMFVEKVRDNCGALSQSAR